MKHFFYLIIMLLIVACDRPGNCDKTIQGTWSLIYSDITEQDSTVVKDLSNTNFIKIINQDHFAFFNQVTDSEDGYYGGAGTYVFDGNKYSETLSFIKSAEWRNHTFDFTIELKGDTLIQQGLEEIEGTGVKRYIVEKYIRIQ